MNAKGFYESYDGKQYRMNMWRETPNSTIRDRRIEPVNWEA